MIRSTCFTVKKNPDVALLAEEHRVLNLVQDVCVLSSPDLPAARLGDLYIVRLLRGEWELPLQTTESLL